MDCHGDGYRSTIPLAPTTSPAFARYDLKFSIERYDKDTDQLLARENLDLAQAQAKIQSQILREQQYANYLSEQTQNILADNNDILHYKSHTHS